MRTADISRRKKNSKLSKLSLQCRSTNTAGHKLVGDAAARRGHAARRGNAPSTSQAALAAPPAHAGAIVRRAGDSSRTLLPTVAVPRVRGLRLPGRAGAGGSAPARRATQPALLQRGAQRHARLVVSEKLRDFVDVYVHVYPRSRTRKG